VTSQTLMMTGTDNIGSGEFK